MNNSARIQAMRSRRARQSQSLDNLQTGTYGTSGEKISWSYYDESAVPATAQTLVQFQTPIGGTKTLAHTNMVAAGQIPQGQKFVVEKIKVMYRSVSGVSTPAEANELMAFMDRAIIQFKISNKAPMMQAKLSDVMGLSLMAPITGTGGTASFSQGVFTGEWKLHTPITVGALTPFQVEIVLNDVPAASVVADILTTSLKGTLIRAL